MILEFQRAKRMRDALDRVRLAVREIVGRIDTPCIARTWVRLVHDAVNHGVAHVDVAGRHVDLGPQHLGAVRKFAVLHTGEEIEILFDAAPAIGAVLAGLSQRAAIGADFLGVQIVDIGLTIFDQVHGPVIELIEIVGGMARRAVPFEAHPADVFLDGVDELLFFLGRVGVVEPQPAEAFELRCDTEVETDRLGVSDVQVAVRFRGKAGDELIRRAVGKIASDPFTDEVPGFRGGVCLGFGLVHRYSGRLIWLRPGRSRMSGHVGCMSAKIAGKVKAKAVLEKPEP